MLRKILLILAIATVTACSNSGSHMSSQAQEGRIRTNLPENIGNGVTLDQFAKLHDFYNNWQGVRYRMGGTTKQGIDCSAFVLNAFDRAFGMSMPRSTAEQRHVGSKINKSELEFGDLVFFRKNNHVGIYIGNNQFIHASTSQGVTTSSLSENYWARNYTQSRRVIH
ncbi:endopeptidase [Testudinibacter sp. TR-2022]|uniref:NlpC/P60 family protein n=1 Tax=Testudinibacter sp. TR-2022 TaxID=2585029 RepID=UPI00111A0170|nr:NlpC/P60 family protein [Testudinibacter sp. TR-2022]TNH04979.1 endopeptidase [Pasteurellaceae bacterium Phil31]TNH09330.1 endopeptidase [Testudinibacter sp. TR-2022]TNH09616.1 endopeptidase [Testudinibacter sp. TR-2022]TNH13489.1 endopeptidase [Testudinibacter sp. TR-2022]TNH19160.1 endopeptidase [Testudinibacter sp. TR-2022]